jgi:hemerythrin
LNNDKIFQWHDNYSVGIYEIDRQHKEIIKLITDLSLLCVIDDKQSYDTFKLMLSSAAEYLENHFREEEKHMLERNYPEYIKHERHHKRMLEKVKKMINNIGKDDDITIKSITEYLKRWYREHLLGPDKAMGKYFKDMEEAGR